MVCHSDPQYLYMKISTRWTGQTPLTNSQPPRHHHTPTNNSSTTSHKIRRKSRTPNPPPSATRPNLTSQQRSTLKKLGSNPDLVIKLFHKGNGICLMDTSLYISKIEEHLADPSTYKELSSDPTQAIRNDILSTLNYFYHNHQIDDVTWHHLTPPKLARTPPFYGLPKVHKSNMLFGQQYQHVTASPINFGTMSPTSYNLLWKYSPHTSETANTFYSSLNTPTST